MKKFVCRMSTLMLLGLATGVATADERSDANASCRQETKQVVVWSHGPKAAPTARVEQRVVTVCQAKVS